MEVSRETENSSDGVGACSEDILRRVNMWGRFPIWWVRWPGKPEYRLTPKELLTAGLFSAHADKDTGLTDVSLPTIAFLLGHESPNPDGGFGANPRHVRRAVQTLTRAKILSLVSQRRGRSSVYRVNTDLVLSDGVVVPSRLNRSKSIGPGHYPGPNPRPNPGPRSPGKQMVEQIQNNNTVVASPYAEIRSRMISLGCDRYRAAELIEANAGLTEQWVNAYPTVQADHKIRNKWGYIYSAVVEGRYPPGVESPKQDCPFGLLAAEDRQRLIDAATPEARREYPNATTTLPQAAERIARERYNASHPGK